MPQPVATYRWQEAAATLTAEERRHFPVQYVLLCSCVPRHHIDIITMRRISESYITFILFGAECDCTAYVARYPWHA